MHKLNTPDLVEAVQVKVERWLEPKELSTGKRSYIQLHSLGTRINTSKRAIRYYLVRALQHICTNRQGTDSKEELGYYTVTSSKDHSYVVVRPTSKQVPKTPGKFINWVDWDVKVTGHQVNLEVLHCIAERRCFIDRYSNRRLSDRINLSNLCILSQVMLQCLFNPQGELDLKSKPLPENDMRCRVGSYDMLYDTLAKEWRIKEKS